MGSLLLSRPATVPRQAQRSDFVISRSGVRVTPPAPGTALYSSVVLFIFKQHYLEKPECYRTLRLFAFL